MKYFSQFLILFFLFSCNRNDNKINNCVYTLDNLVKDFDTSLLVKEEYKNENMIEFWDKKNLIGHRGMYKFDKNKILKFYAFILNSTNESLFAVEYDSLGNEILKTKTEVVQWYFRKVNTDSIAVTFLLYGINYLYDSIQVQIENETIKNIQLVKSPNFSNLLVKTIYAPFKQDIRQKTIHIVGIKTNDCTKEIISFKDSIQISDELFIKPIRH